MKNVTLPSLDRTPSLPQTLPQSVLDFTRSLHNITAPYPVHVPGFVDPINPHFG